jgi:hypothetical protein
VQVIFTSTSHATGFCPIGASVSGDAGSALGIELGDIVTDVGPPTGASVSFVGEVGSTLGVAVGDCVPGVSGEATGVPVAISDGSELGTATGNSIPLGASLDNTIGALVSGSVGGTDVGGSTGDGATGVGGGICDIWKLYSSESSQVLPLGGFASTSTYTENSEELQALMLKDAKMAVLSPGSSGLVSTSPRRSIVSLLNVKSTVDTFISTVPTF